MAPLTFDAAYDGEDLHKKFVDIVLNTARNEMLMLKLDQLRMIMIVSLRPCCSQTLFLKMVIYILPVNPSLLLGSSLEEEKEDN